VDSLNIYGDVALMLKKVHRRRPMSSTRRNKDEIIKKDENTLLERRRHLIKERMHTIRDMVDSGRKLNLIMPYLI